MRRFITGIILFIIISVPKLEATEKNSSFDWYIEGVRQYCIALDNPTKKNIEKTIALLTKAIELNPSNDAAYYYLGLAFYQSSDIDNALKYIKAAENLDPDNYWYKVLIARLYNHSGENDMAIDLYEKLITRFPKKLISYYELLDIYIKNNNIDKAFEYLNKIETMHGADEMTANVRYQLLMMENKKEEALNVLLKLDEESASPVTSFMIGDMYKEQFKDSLALQYYDKAINISHNYMPAYFGRAEIYRMRMDMDNYFKNIYIFISSPDIMPDMKIDYLEKAVINPNMIYAFKPQFDTLMNCLNQAHPYDTLTSNYIGLYKIATGDTLGGIKIFRDCIDHNPESASAYMNFILALYNIKNWEDIKKIGNEALKFAPNHLGINELLAMAYWQSGNTEKAIKKYKNLIALLPKESPMLINCFAALGDLYSISNNFKKTYKYYEKGLKIDSDYSPILNNYAYYLSLQNKKLDKALNMSRRTIEKEPENSTYLDTYGWILYLKGDYAEAKKVLKKAIMYGGKESAAIMDHYAEILFVTGDYDLAFLYWSDAEKLDPSLGIDKKIKDRRKKIKSE